MDDDCLKLTTYCGERDRHGGRLLAGALLDLYGRHGLASSVLLRGAEGFGAKQRLQTQRLLTLSEDLPLVTVAVDARERIEALLPEAEALVTEGLVTVERARMLSGEVGEARLPEDLRGATKLTVHCGRQERAGARPAALAVVDLLHRHGIAGATVLLGVDGTVRGERRRARFFARNADVPLMVISVGSGEAIASALPALGALLERPLLTLERVTACKRDGERLADPAAVPTVYPGRPEFEAWQKLTVYAGEQSRHEGRPLYASLVRALRAAGAAGATVLRGTWGYHGAHAPHGDRFLALRRRVPVVTVVLDTPERIARWYRIVDEHTAETGLVTSEMVPAARIRQPAARAARARAA